MGERTEDQVIHLMRKGAITCSEDTSIKEVAQVMVVNHIRYCVVATKKNEVLGIISARSILKGFDMDLENTKAKDILLPYTFTVTPSTLIKDAIELMSAKKIEHLIVVSDRPGDKMIIGILHAKDILGDMASTN